MGERVIASDGLVARSVGAWSEDKFYYLDRICFIFSRGMKRWRNRCFIDLFAGPGKAIVRETGKEIDGSPLIALACEEPFSHYYFVDDKEEYIEALQTRVEECAPNAGVRYYAKDCNEAVSEIVRDLPTSPDLLCLAFIDPTGVQIQMDSIAELTHQRRVDLLINYTQHMAVQRITTLPGSEPDLDKFFGSAQWKQVLEAARSRQEHEGDALREFYKSRLASLGYKAPSFGDQLIRSDRRMPLYYLLYASKHERGIDFWRKISKRDHTGQEDFIGPLDEQE